MVHGCRPYSATIQPISAAIQGSGMLYSASLSSQLCRRMLRFARK